MKLFSWNMNGIRAVERKGLLQPFIQHYQPDILCVQETKANQDQCTLALRDYEEHWYSAEKKGYSGTAIFTKIPPLSVQYGLPKEITAQYLLTDTYGDTTTEGRVLTVEFEPCFITTVYTPNAKDDLSRIRMRQQWDPAFLEYMKYLETKKPVIFCGDFNVAHTELDLARPKENQGKKGFTAEEREGFEAFLTNGFVDTFRLFHREGGHYTWWSNFGQARARNIGWRIDYVLASQTLVPFLRHARIHPEVLGSDHCPVSIEIALDIE